MQRDREKQRDKEKMTFKGEAVENEDGRARHAARFACRALAAALCLLSLCGAAARASTFDDYQRRVHGATIALDALASPDEETSREEHVLKIDRTLDEVRRLLPPSEQVVWRGETLNVDNAWLHTAIDATHRISEYEALVVALAGITERLRALSDRLEEINPMPRAGDGSASPRSDSTTPPTAQTRAEKERLANILRRAEYARADEKKETAAARFIEQVETWVSNLFPRQRATRPGTSRRFSTAAQFFVYALALAVVAFVLWKYGRRFFERGRLRHVELDGTRVILGERLAPEQTPADLLAEAEQMARAGDLRGAIRKAYIALLCELGERKILRLAQHKTNRDYLLALRRERGALYEEVQPLTSNFERHWYGRESATDQDWADFRTRCRQILVTSSR